MQKDIQKAMHKDTHIAVKKGGKGEWIPFCKESKHDFTVGQFKLATPLCDIWL